MLSYVGVFAAEDNLYEYDFSGVSGGSTPSYVTGTAKVSAEGEWIDAKENYAKFTASDICENASFTAKVRSNGNISLRVYDGGNFESVHFKPIDNSWQELIVSLDGENLTVICGTKQADVRGVSEIEKIGAVEIFGAEIDDVKIGEQVLKPKILEPSMYYSGEGTEIILSYIVFSPNGETVSPITTWKTANTKDGAYTQIKSGTQVWVANPGEDKYICADISYNDENISLKPKKVCDIDILIFNEAKNSVGGSEFTFSRLDGENVRQWTPSISNWSEYDEIVFKVQSLKSTGRVFQVYLSSENADYTSNDYYNTFFTVNWGGCYKNLSFKIGDDAGLEASGHPKGFNNMTGVAFYTRLTKSQEDDGGVFARNEKDPDKQTNLWISSVVLRKAEEESDFWDNDYIINDVKKDAAIDYAEKIMAKSHPRLLLTEEKITQLKTDIVNNDYLKKSYEKLEGDVESYLSNGPLTKANTGTCGYVTAAAMLYNLNPTTKLKNWIWSSCENLSKNVTTWNPGSESFLSVGNTLSAMAFTYDWMYNHWTESQRKIVRNAIMKHGIMAVLPKMRAETGWAVGPGNWCQAIVSGAGLGALAISDKREYSESANEVLDRAIYGLKNGLKDINTNGSYPEGTAYWQYAMDCFTEFEASLYGVLGTNYGLLAGEGMSETGYFPIMLTGMTGTFNFSDATNVANTPSHAFYRLAEYFDNPAFGNYQYESTKEKGGGYMSMLLYDTDGYSDYIESMPKWKYFSGDTESFVMRTDYEKGTDGMYLGFKGGDNTVGHGQLDAGSFVYDYKNVRFFWDMGRDSYEYKDRWELYRNRAEGNNCLVINPDKSPDQDPTGYSFVEEHRVTDRAGYAIINMTDAYDTVGATEVKRGFMMLDSFNTLVIRDEIKAENVTELYSFLHTGATIDYADDRQSARLTIGGLRHSGTS